MLDGVREKNRDRELCRGAKAGFTISGTTLMPQIDVLRRSDSRRATARLRPCPDDSVAPVRFLGLNPRVCRVDAMELNLIDKT